MQAGIIYLKAKNSTNYLSYKEEAKNKETNFSPFL